MLDLTEYTKFTAPVHIFISQKASLSEHSCLPEYDVQQPATNPPNMTTASASAITNNVYLPRWVITSTHIMKIRTFNAVLTIAHH